MRLILPAFLACGLVSVLAPSPAPAREDAVKPPEGFVAVFNGVDLAGWHGMPTYSPLKLAAMPEAERAALLAKWLGEVKQHWSVRAGDLYNDGFGAYLTTDKDYGDIE